MVRLGGSRAGSAGFGTPVGWWEYLCTQCGAIVHYLRLSVWPSPLVLDYGAHLARGFWEIAPYALVLVILGILAAIVIPKFSGRTKQAQVAAARKRQREQSKALLAEVSTLRKAIERLESGELEVVSLPKSDFAPDGTWIVDRAALIELGADYAANFDGLGNRITRDSGKKR